jgi:hypothetical protein
VSTSRITTTLDACLADQPGIALRTIAVYELTDPYAVTLDFPSPTGASASRWCFARALLTDGLCEATGLGDVRVGPAEADGYLQLALFPHGPKPLVLFLRRDQVESFLARTYRRVPMGGEHEWLCLDDELAALFREAS